MLIHEDAAVPSLIDIPTDIRIVGQDVPLDENMMRAMRVRDPDSAEFMAEFDPSGRVDLFAHMAHSPYEYAPLNLFVKLKDVKDKQKVAEELDRRKLGLESLKKALPKESGGSLEERYDSLRKMIGSAEKKYFQRKIDKETFRKMVEDAEREKSELEVKMKKKKK